MKNRWTDFWENDSGWYWTKKSAWLAYWIVMAVMAIGTLLMLMWSNSF